MSGENLQRLKAEIEEHPDKTLGEMKEELKSAVQRIRIKQNRPGKAGVQSEKEGDTRHQTGAALMCRKA